MKKKSLYTGKFRYAIFSLLILFTGLNYSQFQDITEEVGFKTNNANGDIYLFGKSNKETLKIVQLNRNFEILDSTTIEDPLLSGNNFEFYFSPLGIEILITKKDKKILKSKFLTTDLIERQEQENDKYIRFFQESFFFEKNGLVGLFQIDNNRIDEERYGSADWLIEAYKEDFPFSYHYKYEGDSKIVFFLEQNENFKLQNEISLNNSIAGVLSSSVIFDDKIQIITNESKSKEITLQEIDFNSFAIKELANIKQPDGLNLSSCFYWDHDSTFYLAYYDLVQNEKTHNISSQIFSLNDNHTLTPVTDLNGILLDLPNKKSSISSTTLFIPREKYLYAINDYNEYVSYSDGGFFRTIAFEETVLESNKEPQVNTIIIDEYRDQFVEDKEAYNIYFMRHSMFHEFFTYGHKIFHLSQDRIIGEFSKKNRDLIIINFDDYSIKRKNWHGQDKFPLENGIKNKYYLKMGAAYYDYASILLQSYDEEKLLVIKIDDYKGNSFPLPIFKIELINTVDFQ